MTAQQQPGSAASEHPVDERPPRRIGRFVGVVLSGIVLVVGNALTLFCTVLAWLMMPDGLGDTNSIDGAWFSGFAGMVLAVVTVLLTIVPVAARWLGKKWFILPVVLLVLATARWMYIGEVYPPPPDKYRYGSSWLSVNDLAVGSLIDGRRPG